MSAVNSHNAMRFRVRIDLLAALGVALIAATFSAEASRGDTFVRLTFNSAIDRHPSWTPDGRYIVYESSESGVLRIHKIPVDGGPSVMLSTGPGADRFPEVSPDGTRIVFTREDFSGGASLYMMPASGGIASQLTLPDAPLDNDWHGAFSPDGNTVYFSRRLGSGTAHWDIFKVPAAGGPHFATLVYTAPGIQNRPHISRDGLKITFENDFGGPALNVIEAPLSNPANQTQLTFYSQNTASLEYSRDDKLLLFSTRQNLGRFDMWELDLATLAKTQLTFDAAAFPYDPANVDGAYSPDGSMIAFTSRRTTGQDEIWLLKLSRGPVFAACPSCPAPPDPVVPGQDFNFTFDICNCGSSADTFAWCLADSAGWFAPICDQGVLTPGECRTVTVPIHVPPDVADGKLNPITVSVEQGRLPFVQQTCQTVVPVDLPPVGVVLSRFTATTDEAGLTLYWDAIADDAHSFFNVGRGTDASGPFATLNSSPILADPSIGDGHFSFTDVALHPGEAFVYRLEAVERSGRRSVVGVASFVHGEFRPPTLRLASAPNPFRESTRISVSLAEAGTCQVRIFDSQGQLIKSIASSGEVAAGEHIYEWGGDTQSGAPAPSGFYLIRAEAGGKSISTRVLRIK